MRSLREIESRILEDRPRDTTALHLARAVATLRPEASGYLSLPMLDLLARGLPTEAANAVTSMDRPTRFFTAETLRTVYDAAEYLASERIGLLEQRFELLLDGRDMPINLEPEVVAEAIESGTLYAPDTGVAVPDWKRRISVFYSPSPALLELLREQSKRWFVGLYVPEQTDPGHTYDRSECEVKIQVCPAARAVELQDKWIAELQPRDNRAGLEEAPF